MIEALLCKRCSGSLPAPSDESPFLACAYCGTTHMIAAPRIELPTPVADNSHYGTRKTAAIAAWEHARAASKDPIVALRAMVAVVAHTAKDEPEVERTARLAEAAIAAFDKANKTQIILEQNAVHRVAEGAAKAVVELRSVASTELNLPFLTATSAGPLHLQQVVTRETLAKLGQVLEVQVVETPPAEPPKKKKKWWQFGGD